MYGITDKTAAGHQIWTFTQDHADQRAAVSLIPPISTISATILRISVIVALFFYCRNVRVNTRVNIRLLNESRVLRKRASENLLPV